MTSRPICLALILLSVTTWLACCGMSNAGSKDTKTLILRARVGKCAKLIVITKTVTFHHKDPGEGESIQAAENDVRVVVKARTEGTSPVTLFAVADGDLASGSETIPIENVTWQTSGQGFIGGTLSKTMPQKAGSWTGSGIHEGSFRYFLKNTWNYPEGNYQTTITYTLTIP